MVAQASLMAYVSSVASLVAYVLLSANVWLLAEVKLLTKFVTIFWLAVVYKKGACTYGHNKHSYLSIVHS